MKHSMINRKSLPWFIGTLVLFGVLQGLILIGVIDAFYQMMLMMILINIILAVGLNVIIGVAGQFSLGHAGFMSIGAYACAITTLSKPDMTGFALGVGLGLLINFAVAILVALPSLRLKGDYLAIATLGIGEVIRIVILNLDITNRAAGLSFIPMLVNFPMVYVITAIAVALSANFKRSAIGRACLSIQQDEIAAEAMGIHTTKYKTMAFVFGALLASIAGAIYASFFYVIKPDTFGIAKSIDILVIVVFGGLGSVTGSVVAAVVLGIISQFLQQFSSLRMIIYALALVLVMILRPGGLLGTRELSLVSLIRRFKEFISRKHANA